MAINTNPTFTPGQRLTQEQLAQMLALVPQGWKPGDGAFETEGGMQAGPTSWSTPGKFSPEISWDPTMVQRGTSVGADAEYVADPNGGGRRLIVQPNNVSNLGGNDSSFVWDENGNPLGTSSGMAPARGLATILAMAAGGAYTNGGFGAGSAGGGGAAGAAGMTTAEQAAFLEANAGAFAPGAEIAAGYGNTWGVGADGILGNGATMLADGSPVDPWQLEDPANYSNEGNNYQKPQGTPDQPNSPANGTPDTPGGTPPTSNPPTTKPPTTNTPYTLKDGAQLAGTALRVIGNNQDPGGGGVDGDPDQKLLDAQLSSMAMQEQLMQRMISNADMIMPFQRDALQFGMDTAREAYGDYRDDRAYALTRRDQLTGLQDQMITDARTFNTEDKREELAGQAIADVTRAYSSAAEQAGRMMTRRGMNTGDGRWGNTIRQLVADQALAQTGAANNARTQARAEGYKLTDRAAGALSNSPALVSQATGNGQGAGAQPLGMSNNTASAIQAGLTPAASLAGQWGSNATSMYNAQKNNGGNSGTDWGGYGALLAGAAKAWDAFGS